MRRAGASCAMLLVAGLVGAVPSAHARAPAPAGHRLIFDYAPSPDRSAPRPPASITVPGMLDGIVRTDGGAAAAGTAKVLVLAIEYADVAGPASITRPSVTNMVLGPQGSGSVKDYYLENSYGALTLTGAVEGPTATTLWFRDTAHTLAYWGTNGSGPGSCPYSVWDSRNGCVYDLVRTLVRLADPVVNFSSYDADGDLFVDHLIVLHAGGGEELPPFTPTNIRSHRWAMLDPRAGIVPDPCGRAGMNPTDGELVDGVCAFAYTMQGADVPMGTWAHEFGHDLGLPDLYDTDGGSEGAGEWDIMASGGYLGTPLGTKPAHMSAHSKMRLGWLTPSVVDAPGGTLSVAAAATSPSAIKVSAFDPGEPNEYFLIENRQRAGFDGALRGTGLLIWHVDDDLYDARLDANSVNADETHKGLDLEEADESASHPSDLDTQTNRSDAFDPYHAGNTSPGYEGAFGPLTSPASVPYGGTQLTSVIVDTVSASAATMTFRLVFGDSTPPVTTAAVSGTAGSGGWFRSCTTVTLTATDAGSGVAATFYRVDGGAVLGYSAPFGVCGDGTHDVVSWSTDRAGNEEPPGSTPVRIDTVAPVTSTALSGTSGSGGWFRSAATVTLAAADATSGVASIRYRVDGGAFATYGSPFTVSGTGTHTVDVFSTDAAGNAEAVKSTAVRIDTVAPVTSASLGGAAGTDGWWRSPVTVTLSAADVPSGVASTSARTDGAAFATYTSPITVGAQGSHAVDFFATDVAGNVEAVKSSSFKIDSVAPVTTRTVSCPTPGAAGWCRGPATVRPASADATSGVAETRCRVDAGAYAIVPPGGSVNVTGDGVHTVACFSTDLAGNAEAAGASTVPIDASAPASDVAYGGTQGDNGWWRSAVDVYLAASDAASGVARIRFSIDAGAETTYSGPVTVEGDGTHDVRHYAVDVAGNVEAARTGQFRIDTVAPTGTIETPSMRPIAPVAGATAVTASASDERSGVDRVDFLVDGAVRATSFGPEYRWTWTPGLLETGVHTLSARAWDTAGNAAIIDSVTVVVVP